MGASQPRPTLHSLHWVDDCAPTAAVVVALGQGQQTNLAGLAHSDRNQVPTGHRLQGLLLPAP